MKKLISILGVSTLVMSSTLALTACRGKNGGGVDNSYFDSELDKVDPTIRNQVKYTSSIAKILIAARHENMNTYAFPALQYFLNNVGTNLAGTFKTKSGQEVKIKDYIDGYKKLNNMTWNTRSAGDSSYNGEVNKWDIMNTMVEMNNFNKWNVESGRPTDNDFEVNPNTAWAFYDTGAMVNSISQKADSVLDYVNKTSGWWPYYQSQSGQPGASNIIYNNFIGTSPTTSQLGYTTNSGKQTINYGSKIANQASNLFNLYGTKYFNLAISSLANFGPGMEMPTIQALTKIFPVAATDEAGETTMGVLLAAPMAIMAVQAYSDWFKSDNTIKDESPLLKIFSEDTLNNLKVKFKDDKGTAQDLNLGGILQKINPEIMPYFIGGANEKQYLDLTNPDHKNRFLKWYAILSDWFKKAIAKEEAASGKKFDTAKFNQVLPTAIYEEIKKLQDGLLKYVTMATDAAVLLRTVTEMFSQPGFDLFNLLQGIGGLASWFYKWDSTQEDFVVNTTNVEHITKVYNDGPKANGYNANLTNVDPKSDYGQMLLSEFGLDSSTNTYTKGSLFDMINTWAHGSDGSNPNNEAMHQFILNALDSKNGYLGKLLNNVDQAMANDWFDNIFLNRKWYISADGTGVDGSKLGKVVKDGQIVGVRYQLDYYGPKDASTKLEYHTSPLGYTDPTTGKVPSWAPDPNPKPSDKHNIAPQDGGTWDDNDWKGYDGDGNAYLANSEHVKYSYVVEFDDEARLINAFTGKGDLNQQSYKLSDFAWYYNGKRYY
ncbi:hypothetical protein [Spiroplasma sp. DGKH1]|uniref:hypothetical protein n=1 Tax=Spiroplasma sp. DGKH1 TaxID=3050074 RepID=UPI0034C642D3